MYVLTDVTPEDDVVSWIYSQGQLENLEQLEDYKAPGGGKAYIFRETIPGCGNRYRALFCEGPVVVQLDLSIMTDGSLVGRTASTACSMRRASCPTAPWTATACRPCNIPGKTVQ